MNEVEKDTIMKFPCQFPIKVMGKVSDDFDIVVGDIVRKHAPELSKNAVKSKPANQQTQFIIDLIKGLTKASKTHATQARTLKDVVKKGKQRKA